MDYNQIYIRPNMAHIWNQIQWANQDHYTQ